MTKALKTFEILLQRAEGKGVLEIQNENGSLSIAGFGLSPACDEKTIGDLVTVFGERLPDEYIEFLRICNGAELFLDKEFGQWGCVILPGSDFIEQNRNNADGLLKFAYWKGDGDILLFDSSKYSSSRKDYIVDGDEGYPSSEWTYIRGTFAKWLDRLIVSQGSKYWRW